MIRLACRLDSSVRPGGQQTQCQVALIPIHIPERQSVSVQWRVVPENPFAIHVVESCLAALLAVEAVQPGAGRIGHAAGDRSVGVACAEPSSLMTSCCRLNIDSAAVYEPCVWHVKNTRPLTRTRFVKPHWPTVIARSAAAHGEPVEPRGNLVEVEHTSANHHCYANEIATPVSSTRSQ